MLTFEPNVVVIDDKHDEVKGIIDYYRNKGIGCKYFNASQDSEDSYPEKPFSDASLFFLDLYYTEGLNGFDAELCVSWIITSISKNSFYILVIWTREIEHEQEIISLLRKEERLPFVYLTRNKNDFPSQDPEIKYDFSGLIVEINSVLENIPALSEIGVWKKNVKSASNRVVGGLTKDNNPEIFKSKLQKIIMNHGGQSMLEANETRKRTILFDALDQVLLSNTGNPIFYDEINEINKEQLYTLAREIDIPVDKELNSWFHFKLENGDLRELIVPGLISKMNHTFIKNCFSISNDLKLEPKLRNQVANRVEIIDIVVVLSRPCDIAQNKYGKNIKLLSGIIIKSPHRIAAGKKAGEIDFCGSSLPDSTKLYDHLKIDEEKNDVALLFDFRYAFSVPTQIFIKKFTNIKIFNKELYSELQVEYSSYSSRLGITQII